jgi:hypothetical protein
MIGAAGLVGIERPAIAKKTVLQHQAWLKIRGAMGEQYG